VEPTTKTQPDILAFCHIVKAAGTTFSDLLRKNNGIAHLNVEPHPSSECYTSTNLIRDLKILPFAKSLAGHGLRPYIDYGDAGKRLWWVTWLRDPVQRLISGYQHGVEKNGLNTPFEKWLTEPGHKNRQIYFLTGSDCDLEAAKQIILDKNIFVGLVEDFEFSVALMKELCPTQCLDISYPKTSNRALHGKIAADLNDSIDYYLDLIEENTQLDKALYDWTKETIFRKQAEEANLTEADFKQQDGTGYSHSISDKVNMKINLGFRHAVYKPFIRHF